MIKRGLSSKTATSEIDQAYARARAAGAVGGKLLGAGGGGFLLLYVEPDRLSEARVELTELPNPWYGRWWVWAIAGTALVAGATATVYALTRPSPNTASGNLVIGPAGP